MTKLKLLTGGRGGDHIADLHLLVGHDNTINQQLNQVSFLLKGGLCKSLRTRSDKRFLRIVPYLSIHRVADTDFQLACLFRNACCRCSSSCLRRWYSSSGRTAAR